VWFEAAQGAQEVGVVGERRVGRERLEARVVDRRQLEIDEDEQGAQIGLLLGRALFEVEGLGPASLGSGEQGGVEAGTLAELEEVLVLDERTSARCRASWASTARRGSSGPSYSSPRFQRTESAATRDM
jgi:hypothetical protein